MKTTFALLQQACGLSNREAAEFLSVPVNTVEGWRMGRRTCPSGAIDELRSLFSKIENAANENIKLTSKLTTEHGVPDEIELGLASDDYEAQTLGWPCVGAQEACYGLVIARLPHKFKIVPRGSNAATAKAADENDL